MIFSIIKKWFTNISVTTNSGFNYKIKYSFWKLNDPLLLDFIERKAMELAKNENIPIFFSSFEEMNKHETIEEEKAVGIFKYIGNEERRIQYEKNVAKFKQINYTIPKTDVYPRIEISEKGDVFTILHELGHYFIYKRGQEQSELGANQFIEEFFDNYLPPFFKWIYQNEIKNRCNMDLNFTVDECKEHWKQYCEFRNNFDK